MSVAGEAVRLRAADLPRCASYGPHGLTGISFATRHAAAHYRRTCLAPSRTAPLAGYFEAATFSFFCGERAGEPPCPLGVVFHGRRVQGEAEVRTWWSDDFSRWTPLALRRELVDHSPTGFEWSYPGSGPAQLALATCALVLGDERATKNGLYQRVRGAMFDGLRGEEWLLHAADLETLVLALEAGQPAGRLGANLVKVVTLSDPHA